MKEIKFFCDICGKEFTPQEFSFLTGQIVKVDKDLKPFNVPFEGHYCGECTPKVVEEISKLKNAENSNTQPVGKQVKQRATNK